MTDETEYIKLEIAEKIDRICDSYESEWKSGKHPLIEEFLVKTDATVHTQLISELENIDRHYRSKLPPEKIGKYLVEKLLGEGGYGRVFLANDPELQRKVAIKLPHAHKSFDRDAFLQEAKKIVALDHPNIVPVYGYGTTEEGLPYVVSKYISDEDLAKRLRRKPFDRKEAAKIVASVAEALEFIHRRNVIHRDIKPSNILINENNKPFLTDFGMSKDLNASATMTSDGNIRGTLSYMSPEQAAGISKNIDARSDIYSLGIVLYEMLCGQPPFTGSTFPLLDQIKNKLPVEPRKIEPSIPRSLQAICLQAIEKEKSKRYKSANAFQDDLNRYLEGKPVSARRSDWLSSRLPRISRRQAMVLGGSALAIAGISTAGYWIGNLSSSSPPASATTRTVLIDSEPAGAKFVFVPLDENHQHIEDEIVRFESNTGSAVELEPGHYFVVASLPNGDFHEVYRYVPSEDEADKLSSNYRHWNWDSEDDRIILPSIRIQSKGDLIPNMSKFEGGRFEMGLKDSPYPAHERQVAPFSLDTFEATIHDFQKQYGDLPSDLQKNLPSLEPQHAVTHVTFDQAVAFAEKIGKRLPTEVEYELVASNNGTTLYPWGDDPGLVGEWSFDIVRQKEFDRTLDKTPVYGLYSNVAEWIDSVALTYPGLQEPPDPQYQDLVRSSRVVRGCAFSLENGKFNEYNYGFGVRTRQQRLMFDACKYLGYRCALSAHPSYM